MSPADDFATVGKAVSDPTRIRILCALSVRGLCVSELVHLMDLGQPAISRHLGILREAGLVDDVRDGRFVNYRLRRPARVAFAAAVVRGLIESQSDDPELTALRERARTVDRFLL
jgi:ArsR family transcriptional regulator